MLTAEIYPHLGTMPHHSARFFPHWSIWSPFFTLLLFTKRSPRLRISACFCLVTLRPQNTYKSLCFSKENSLRTLHWLPNFYTIIKVYYLLLKALTLNGCCLLYLVEHNPLSPKPSRGQNWKAKSLWGRAFRNFAPQLWNMLPHFYLQVYCSLSN